MISKNDLSKKFLIAYIPESGETMSFKNDNMIIRHADKTIKMQVTCYRIFMVFVIGDTTITTGLIKKSVDFGFSVCLMNRNMKIYKFIGSRTEGNTMLRQAQYTGDYSNLAHHIIKNKIENQRRALGKIRNKNADLKETIRKLDYYAGSITKELSNDSLRGIEGNAAKMYFSRMFSMPEWNGRKPRIKADYINASLDIGYTILFNYIDALLNAFGFDEYKGVFHTAFFNRKSLVCDIIEPFRPIVDYATRSAYNLKQIKKEDFKINNDAYFLDWKNSKKYTSLYLKAIDEYKEEIFVYIRTLYRYYSTPSNPMPYYKME